MEWRRNKGRGCTGRDEIVTECHKDPLLLLMAKQDAAGTHLRTGNEHNQDHSQEQKQKKMQKRNQNKTHLTIQSHWLESTSPAT
jgi:hypothetical protein